MNLRHLSGEQKDKEEMSQDILIQSILREKQGQWVKPEPVRALWSKLLQVCLLQRKTCHWTESNVHLQNFVR